MTGVCHWRVRGRAGTSFSGRFACDRWPQSAATPRSRCHQSVQQSPLSITGMRLTGPRCGDTSTPLALVNLDVSRQTFVTHRMCFRRVHVPDAPLWALRGRESGISCPRSADRTQRPGLRLASAVSGHPRHHGFLSSYLSGEGSSPEVRGSEYMSPSRDSSPRSTARESAVLKALRGFAQLAGT